MPVTTGPMSPRYLSFVRTIFISVAVMFTHRITPVGGKALRSGLLFGGET